MQRALGALNPLVTHPFNHPEAQFLEWLNEAVSYPSLSPPHFCMVAMLIIILFHSLLYPILRTLLSPRVSCLFPCIFLMLTCCILSSLLCNRPGGCACLRKEPLCAFPADEDEGDHAAHGLLGVLETHKQVRA
eukprot:1150199-Pelagomonas_calceolata.AAC.7